MAICSFQEGDVIRMVAPCSGELQGSLHTLKWGNNPDALGQKCLWAGRCYCRKNWEKVSGGGEDFVLVAETQEDWDAMMDRFKTGVPKTNFGYYKNDPKYHDEPLCIHICKGKFVSWCRRGWYLKDGETKGLLFLNYKYFASLNKVVEENKEESKKESMATKYFKVLKDTPNYDAGEIINFASASSQAIPVEEVYRRDLGDMDSSYSYIYGYVVQAKENAQFFQRVFPVKSKDETTYMTKDEAIKARAAKE